MNLYDQIRNREAKISVVGLGYVGLPVAAAFSRITDVIGYDHDAAKIRLYQKGMDPTGEVGCTDIRHTAVHFTADPGALEQAKFHIVAVPTPVCDDHTPNLRPLKQASYVLGQHLTRGSIVVYESTVYPGVTEEICIPLLEEASGLRCGVDFKVGYSPERINPGDKAHRLENIVKIVSGMDEQTLDIIARVYALVVTAGVHRARSIRVAEAAKVIENAQRDINIAFMNELSLIFNKMDLDTREVLTAAGTKWNFLRFEPGLVGGHCIGVDPYYLTYKAEQLGHHSQVILAGRRINDDMGRYVAENLVKKLICADIPVKNAQVAVLGLTFKENCPDIRNTRVLDLCRELHEYGITPVISDPVADAAEARRLYGLELMPLHRIRGMDAVILAVAHDAFRTLTVAELDRLYCGTHRRVLVDVKSILDRTAFDRAGYVYWRL